MIPKNLKPGDTFEDGKSIYEVISVVKEGYISKRVGLADKEISNMAIIDKSEPVILDEDINACLLLNRISSPISCIEL